MTSNPVGVDIPRRTLVNLSGGIDSAYCLYLVLKAGSNVLVHHTHLINSEKRHEAEKLAVNRVLNWLWSQELPGRMRYVETVTDFGTLEIQRDLYTWSHWTGIILRSTAHRDRAVIISSHLDSPFMQSDPINRARDARRRAQVEAICGFEPQWVYPIGHMLKANVIRACPRELLVRCWWCRRPRRVGERFIVCDRRNPCHTCRQVDPVLEELSIPNPHI